MPMSYKLYNLPKTTLGFLEQGALALLSSNIGDAALEFLAICAQCEQSIVQTFLVMVGEARVKNRPPPKFGETEREFRSVPPLLEQLLRPPGEDGGL